MLYASRLYSFICYLEAVLIIHRIDEIIFDVLLGQNNIAVQIANINILNGILKYIYWRYENKTDMPIRIILRFHRSRNC